MARSLLSATMAIETGDEVDQGQGPIGDRRSIRGNVMEHRDHELEPCAVRCVVAQHINEGFALLDEQRGGVGLAQERAVVPSLHRALQCCRGRVVNRIGNRTVTDSGNRFINDV